MTGPITQSSLCYIDFETKSRADLKLVGTARYAANWTTDILCAGFVEDLILPGCTHLLDTNEVKNMTGNADILLHLIKDKEVIFVAHNAIFEQLIWQEIMVERYGYPSIPIERWKCTMAKAMACGMPAGLGPVCKALGLSAQKNMQGRANMLILSQPIRAGNRKGRFITKEERPDLFENLYQYCVQDVLATKELDEALPDLSKKETRIWQLDQKMNLQGIHLDLDIIQKAIIISEKFDYIQHEKFKRITGGIPNDARQRNKLISWLKSKGVKIKNTQKATIEKFLQTEALSKDVRTVLEISLLSGKASLGKLPTMLMQSDSSGIVKGILQYHGAHTGRWSGRGIQIQNFPRPTVNPDLVIKALDYCDYDFFLSLYLNVPNAVSSALRKMIIAPPGFVFIGADFSQIEARIVAWLAGQQDKLDLFASGKDLYCEAASKIYGREIAKYNKAERMVGKVAELALGYGGGIGSFATMSQTYNVDLAPIYNGLWQTATNEERQLAEKSYTRYCETAKIKLSREVGLTADLIKQRWRNANFKITSFWIQLEESVRHIINSENSQRCSLLYLEKKSGRWLTIRLPSGRDLYYLNPCIETKNNRIIYDTEVITKSSYSYEGRRVEPTYGGKLVENITQAVARDIMAEAMIRIDNTWPNTFTVHDEIVALSRGLYGELDEFKSKMKQTPIWAKGLPIDVECWTNKRYGK